MPGFESQIITVFCGISRFGFRAFVPLSYREETSASTIQRTISTLMPPCRPALMKCNYGQCILMNLKLNLKLSRLGIVVWDKLIDTERLQCYLMLPVVYRNM